MPQSSDEMYEMMKFICGHENGVDDGPPTEFLIMRGYKLRKDFYWDLPKPDHWVTVKEELCIQFLFEEWDFGGVHASNYPKEIKPVGKVRRWW